MPTTIAHSPPDSDASTSDVRACAWRPFPREAADLLCIEERVGELRPRMHGRYSVTFVRSPAVVRVESGPSVVADRCALLLVPAWQLYALRAPAGAADRAAGAAVTLLFGEHFLEGLRTDDRPAIVIDAELDAEVAALVAQLRRLVPSVECAAKIRLVLEQLATASTPLAAARSSRAAAPLVAVRDHFRTRLGETLTTASVARMSGLTEWHLIRAFHREFGLPPHAYHLRLRLAAVCELLAAGLSVSTATYECGFADQSHLSRKFKEVYGLTPAAWAAAVGGQAQRRTANPFNRDAARRWHPRTL